MSTLEEWLADPAGERALRAAIGTNADGTPAGILGNPEMQRMLGNFPVSTLAAFAEFGLSHEIVDRHRRRARMSAAAGIELTDDTEYTGLDLSELRADERAVACAAGSSRCRFVDADLRGLVTESCSFDECDFTGADLGDSTHRGARVPHLHDAPGHAGRLDVPRLLAARHQRA